MNDDNGFGARHQAATLLLRGIEGEQDREGLAETPERFAVAWHEWTRGYREDFGDILQSFQDGSDGYDEMVLETDIPVYSKCFTAGTFVETPRGRIPIEWISAGDLVYTIEPSTFELKLEPCLKAKRTRTQAKLVRVYTDNDTVLCTPDHRFLTTEGEWVEARALRNGIRLASLYRSAAKGNESYYYPMLLASRYTRHGKGLAIGKGIAEHRFVTHNNERLTITHHRNGRTWDNDPSNLEVLTIGEHNRVHQRTVKFIHDPKRKNAAALSSGRAEVRAKRAASVRYHWANMSTTERNARCEAMRRGIAAARNHQVLGVESVPIKSDVYCLTTRTGTFFANGIAVHNCEHHLADIFGVAHVGYIPQGRIVGLSKIVRLVEHFARRLQVQERMTVQIADSLYSVLHPDGVGVVLQCRHMCMESRGINRPGVVTTTTCLRGSMKEDHSTRAEFLSIINHRRLV